MQHTLSEFFRGGVITVANQCDSCSRKVVDQKKKTSLQNHFSRKGVADQMPECLTTKFP